VTTWTTVKARLGAIQSANHESVSLLGVIPFLGIAQPMRAAEDRERELHHRFRAHQRAKEGQRGYEWFTVTSEMLEYISRESLAPEALNLPRNAR
jgi:hypothetical protein